MFGAADLQRRYPVLRPYDEMVAVFQPNSGFVLAEGSITAHVNAAAITVRRFTATKK
jgi:hypothetical protein